MHACALHQFLSRFAQSGPIDNSATAGTMSFRTTQMMDNVTQGNCVEVMKDLPAGSVDLILTDPPYLVNYKDRSGRQVQNDDNDAWLEPAFAEMHRVLKNGGACLSFYAWNRVDRFMAAWKKAGFHVAGHIVFPKQYASARRFTEYRHEQAYLLTKGNAVPPRNPPPDVIPWVYSGNRLHPTQKPVAIFNPIIEAFTKPGDTVLDPFCGSGSTLMAARNLGRHYIGIELDAAHRGTSCRRLSGDRENRFGQPITLTGEFNRHAPGPRRESRGLTPARAPRGAAFKGVQTFEQARPRPQSKLPKRDSFFK
jgi:site-specific DNA-methyltransferase (adenine-specific)